MKHELFPDFSSERGDLDLLFLPFWEGGEEAASFEKEWTPFYAKAIETKDFRGEAGKTALLYGPGKKVVRIGLLGLGKKGKVSLESLRRAWASAMHLALQKKAKKVGLWCPEIEGMKQKDVVEAMAEGLLLTHYGFWSLKGDSLKEDPPSSVEKLSWVGLPSSEKKTIEQVEKVVSCVDFARDLVNRNADDITPKKLASMALELGKEFPKLQTKLFDREQLEKMGMGLLLAVNRASTLEPFLIQVDYQGKPGSKERTVLVGKGITYDTGGLNLKLQDNMLAMKCDMAGGATVLGAIRALAALEVPCNVTALVPATENDIGSRSYKPGDVYRSYSGKTVEITNTDAEGRLVLADAISYAVKELKPTAILDFATLTGAAVIALGEEIASLFSSDDKIAEKLSLASSRTGEMVWRLPLYKDYFENYKSDIADMVNSGGRDASSMKAALFLQQFVENVPWAHIDIAGPAFWSKPKHYHRTKATGFGVRLLLDYFLKG